MKLQVFNTPTESILGWKTARIIEASELNERELSDINQKMNSSTKMLGKLTIVISSPEIEAVSEKGFKCEFPIYDREIKNKDGAVIGLSGSWNVERLLRAAGFDLDRGEIDVDPQELINKEAMFFLEKVEGRDGKTYTEVYSGYVLPTDPSDLQIQAAEKQYQRDLSYRNGKKTSVSSTTSPTKTFVSPKAVASTPAVATSIPDMDEEEVSDEIPF